MSNPLLSNLGDKSKFSYLLRSFLFTLDAGCVGAFVRPSCLCKLGVLFKVLKRPLIGAKISQLRKFLRYLHIRREKNFQKIDDFLLLFSNSLPLLIELLYFPEHLKI